jgi:hypothetical protein
MTDAPLDNRSMPDIAEAALREAARKVVEEARRTGGTVVVWRNGRVEEIPADQLPTDLDSPISAKKGHAE